MIPAWAWIAFNALILSLLLVDLVVLQRRSRVLSMKQALLWVAFWVGLAVVFGVGVLVYRGPAAALEYAAAYLIEESLSVDNVFVFVVLLAYFQVPRVHQHRVLFWGIIGAVVLRGAFILAGIALVSRFAWMTYVFGALLVVTAVKMLLQGESKVDPSSNPVLRLLRRVLPVTDQHQEGRFLVRAGRRWLFTPLFVALVLVDVADLAFAVDSIPAALAVSRDPFIVYTSNVFAILGLRALYFAVVGVIGMFRCLQYGLCAILAFVGAKMLLAEVVHIPIGWSLGVVAAILAGSIVASLPGAGLGCQPANGSHELAGCAPSQAHAQSEAQPAAESAVVIGEGN